LLLGELLRPLLPAAFELVLEDCLLHHGSDQVRHGQELFTGDLLDWRSESVGKFHGEVVHGDALLNAVANAPGVTDRATKNRLAAVRLVRAVESGL
jgi:hypothetical protein